MLTLVMLLISTALADPRPAPIQPRPAAPRREAVRPAPPRGPAHSTGPTARPAAPRQGGPRYYAPPRYSAPGYFAPRYYSRGYFGPRYYGGYGYPGYYGGGYGYPGYYARGWSAPMYYPPPPVGVVGAAPPVAIAQPRSGAPKAPRAFDRAKSLAVGIRGGSLFGGYEAGEMFVDPGLGLAVRYRPEASVGLEVSGTRFDPTAFLADSPRVHALYDGSVEYFFLPKSRVSPYVLGGATYTLRAFDDDYRRDGQVDTLRARDANWGPHAGAGIELSLGRTVAIDFEARYTALMTAPIEDPTFPGLVTLNAAAMLHF